MTDETEIQPEPELRIAHLYKDVFPPVVGGIERYIESLRQGVPGMRHDVVACSRGWRRRRVETPYGADVLCREFGRMLSVPLSPGYVPTAARVEADLLHLQSPFPLGELAVLARRRSPYVITYQCDIVRQRLLAPVYNPLLRRVLRKAAAVMVSSEAMTRTSPVVSGSGITARVTPLPVDCDYFDPAAADADAMSRLLAEHPRGIVVAVGRAVYYKGFDVLVRAADRIDADVLIVGDGPLLPELRELAADRPNVSFLGAVDDDRLRTVLAAADVFVLPSTSRAEALGIATLEAQSMGVPAVVTDVGTGTVEAIEPDVTGLVVEPGDEEALARAIGSLLEDRERLATMGAAARARAVSRHHPSVHGAMIAGIYRDAIAARSRTHGSRRGPLRWIRELDRGMLAAVVLLAVSLAGTLSVSLTDTLAKGPTPTAAVAAHVADPTRAPARGEVLIEPIAPQGVFPPEIGPDGGAWNWMSDSMVLVPTHSGKAWLAGWMESYRRPRTITFRGVDGTVSRVAVPRAPTPLMVGPLATKSGDPVRVAVQPGPAPGPGADRRRLSVFLSGLVWSTGPVVALPGPGYWPIEHPAGQAAFRWMRTTGTIAVNAQAAGHYSLHAIVASAGGRSRTLTVAGACIAGGRSTVQVTSSAADVRIAQVAPRPGKPCLLHLVASPAAAAVGRDARPLAVSFAALRLVEGSAAG